MCRRHIRVLRGVLEKDGEVFFCRFGETLVFFPDDVHARGERRVKGTEAEGAIAADIDDFIKGECVADAILHHQRPIKNQTIGTGDMKLVGIDAEPIFEHRGGAALAGKNKRLVADILRANARLGSKGAVLSHEDAPSVFIGELDGVVFVVIDGIKD